MSNPWLSIRLQDYEAHMGPDNAKQLSALSDLFKRALDICVPDSVAVLGIAGGYGLEHVNPAIIKRVVGFDINARYLDEVRRRFGTYPNLELHCVDLSEGELRVPLVALVHAALFFEHTGLGTVQRVLAADARNFCGVDEHKHGEDVESRVLRHPQTQRQDDLFRITPNCLRKG